MISDKVLKKIEKTGQWELEKRLFGKGRYIDTPGFCHEKKELKFYGGDIKECIKQNMGSSDFDKLVKFLEENPKKVNKFMGGK